MLNFSGPLQDAGSDKNALGWAAVPRSLGTPQMVTLL
jgi:hypothetical protein